MSIVVYKTDLSGPARAVIMTAEILGVDIETREVNPLTGEQRTPEFLQKNPTHTVPVLEDGDFILSDSHAIVIYLASKYGDKTLYPEDLKTRAIVNHRLFLDATLIFTQLRDVIQSLMFTKVTGPSPQQVENVNEAYGFVEKYLERSEYLAADHITVADVSCVTSVSTLNIIVPISAERFPKVVAWWKKLQAKEWYQKVNVPGLELYVNFYNGLVQKNASS